MQTQHNLSSFYPSREICECVLCADRNCPEWKALYTEARSWCCHHIIQVHTRNIDPTRSEYTRFAVNYARQEGDRSLSVPKVTTHTLQGVSAFH